MKMKAIILAGGEGKRLRPFTYDRPKVMLPIANKPILEYVIKSLKENFVKEIAIITGYKGETIRDYFKNGDEYGVNIKYLQQKHQLGTAHALNVAKDYVDGELFLVLNGDNIIDPLSIHNLLKETAEKNPGILIKNYDGAKFYGTLEIEDNKIQYITEKKEFPNSKIINTGVYMLPKSVFKYIPETVQTGLGEYALTETLNLMIDQGTDITAIKNDGLWADASYPWDLIDLNQKFLSTQSEHRHGKIEDDVKIIGEVTIGEGTTIRSGSYIVGPSTIGENCDIGPHVVIMPSTSIGNNCSIRSFTEITNSVIMDGVRIGAHNIIEESVLGFDSIVKSNVVMNSGQVRKIVQDDIVSFSSGVMVGENVTIESNTVIDPGTIIENNSKIFPNKHVSKDIGQDSVVI